MRRCRGFALVAVLIIIAVGLLLGAGALLTFRYQCQLRIDRQHELEKLYAVRSVLHCIKSDTITSPGRIFDYHTASERHLRLHVRPVEADFPRITNGVTQAVEKRDFVVEWGDFNIPNAKNDKVGGYDRFKDYEYGAEGVTNLQQAIRGAITEIQQGQEGITRGLVFDFNSATSDFARCWVNIGMRGTGGWLHTEYGRRYWCYIPYLDVTKVVRLWLIRDLLDAVDRGDGRSFGWPPSDDDFPLMMKILDRRIELWECRGMTPVKRLCEKELGEECYMGIQIAHDKATLFHSGNAFVDEASRIDASLRGFEFSTVATMSKDTYEYFHRGSVTNKEGEIISSPDVRAIFEVSSDSAQLSANKHVIQVFKVTPGFQYDVLLEYPPGETNRATVAQRLQKIQGQSSITYSVLTYDTHRVGFSGFRKSERNAIRRQREGIK